MKSLACQKEILPFGSGHFICEDSARLLSKENEAIKTLLGKVTLIYLDPPFCTGDCFSIKSGKGKVSAYDDIMSEKEYISMMTKVLLGCKKLLSQEGSIYLHIDYRMSAKLRILLDKIFGEKNFMNEIIWSYNSGGRAKNHFSRKHDTIFLYKNGKKVYFDLTPLGKERGSVKRNNMKREVDENGKVFFSIKSNGKIYKYYETDPIFPTDVWNDIEHLHQKDTERVKYPTQKPGALLNRILLASSYEGATVCDFFSGSGTTAVSADMLGRNWLCADKSLVASLTLRDRLVKANISQRLLDKKGQTIFEYRKAKEDIQPVSALLTEKDNGFSVRLVTEATPWQVSFGNIIGDTFFPFAFSEKPSKNISVDFIDKSAQNFAIHIVDKNAKHSFICCDKK